jgi:thiamine biosynthesis protein ThiI
VLHVTLSGDIFLKSRRTQTRLVRRFKENLTAALIAVGHSGRSRRIGGHRLVVDPEDLDVETVAQTAARVFGVSGVRRIVELPGDDLEALAQEAGSVWAPRVGGRTFAIRAKRSGEHTWRSMDLAVRLGDILRGHGGVVDLDAPEVEVSIRVEDATAYLAVDQWRGPGGLPIGTQDRVLALVSGGFDSTVAAWMMMSRGCSVEFVHFTLNCAQSDHALAVTRELWSAWGRGSEPTVHLVDFQPVKDALLEQVDSRMRQVTLKVLMARAAETIAIDRRIEAIVTGDALGQVSSQTLPHLVAVSRAVATPILRPLVGMPKETIIDRAREIGTAEMSARAREVCDLSEGKPVATSAGRGAIRRAVYAVPELLVDEATTNHKTFLLTDWMPGFA